MTARTASRTIDPPLHTAQEWVLYNHGGAAHPFHIHVNPFQLLEVHDPNNPDNSFKVDPKDADWWDTIAIPRPNGADDPGWVRIRQRYTTYAGDFVIHCHFLNHEDMGMMKKVMVKPATGIPGAKPCERVTRCVRGK